MLDSPLRRARGADILAQLGNTSAHPGNQFPEESFSLVSDLVREEKESLPLLAAIHALGHIRNPLALPLVIPYASHFSEDVRFAVACMLGSFSNDQTAARTLLTLMQDDDKDVRDWATFGLGVQGDLDTAEIRDGLWQRLADSDENVREEAMVGLGKRKDARVLPMLIAELSQPQVSSRVTEAAEELLGDQDQWRDSHPAELAAELKRRYRV
ncbi:MAG TPA: HEAT repeat domain-containing protein [Terriglobia bacterium]|nr:HEAT repeat domain-containing protein [Terriglobia bacterium]